MARSNQELLEERNRLIRQQYLKERESNGWQKYQIESDYELPTNTGFMAKGDYDAWSRYMGVIYRYRIEVPTALTTINKNGIKKQINGDELGYIPHWYNMREYMERVDEENTITVENAKRKESENE